MLILCDLRVLGCLIYDHTGSVSVSWHFFAGTLWSLPSCSGTSPLKPT